MKYLYFLKLICFSQLFFTQNINSNDSVRILNLDEVFVEPVDLKNTDKFKFPNTKEYDHKFTTPIWNHFTAISVVQIPSEFKNKKLVAVEYFINTFGKDDKCKGKFYLKPIIYQSKSENIEDGNDYEFDFIEINENYEGAFNIIVSNKNIIAYNDSLFIGFTIEKDQSSFLKSDKIIFSEKKKLICSRGAVVYQKKVDHAKTKENMKNYLLPENDFTVLKLILYFEK